MRKILISLFLLSFFTGCAAHMTSSRSEYTYYPEPKLELYIRHIDHTNGEVHFDAYLKGTKRALVDPVYHCLQANWIFGDGRSLIKVGLCDQFGNPREEEIKVKFFFQEVNLYKLFQTHKKYTARFQLLNSNNKVVIKSNKVEVKFEY